MPTPAPRLKPSVGVTPEGRGETGPLGDQSADAVVVEPVADRDRELERARGDKRAMNVPTQNRRGKSASAASAETRSETGPLGVADANSPPLVSCLSTSLAARSRSPVILVASPRGTSPRSNTSCAMAVAVLGSPRSRSTYVARRRSSDSNSSSLLMNSSWSSITSQNHWVKSTRAASDRLPRPSRSEAQGASGHQAADSAISVGKRMDIVEPVVSDC